jgi:hypothetical protein
MWCNVQDVRGAVVAAWREVPWTAREPAEKGLSAGALDHRVRFGLFALSTTVTIGACSREAASCGGDGIEPTCCRPRQRCAPHTGAAPPWQLLVWRLEVEAIARSKSPLHWTP